MAWLWGAGGQTRAGGSVLRETLLSVFPRQVSSSLSGGACRGMLLGFRAPSGILDVNFFFIESLYISTVKDPFP